MILSKKRKLAFPQSIGGGGDPEEPDHYSSLRTHTKIQERIQASKVKKEKAPRKKRVASVPSCLRTFRKDQCWTQPNFYVHQEGGLDQKFLGHELLWGRVSTAVLKARKRTSDKEENTTERRQKVVRRRNWCRDSVCQTATNSDTSSPKMKKKQENSPSCSLRGFLQHRAWPQESQNWDGQSASCVLMAGWGPARTDNGEKTTQPLATAEDPVRLKSYIRGWPTMGTTGTVMEPRVDGPDSGRGVGAES